MPELISNSNSSSDDEADPIPPKAQPLIEESDPDMPDLVTN
jgi:hypothetical protein